MFKLVALPQGSIRPSAILIIGSFFLVLAGCAVATEPAHPSAPVSNEGILPKENVMSSTGLAAWTAPQVLRVDQPGMLQVSLHPAVKMSKVILSAISGDADVVISPKNYVLENLTPDRTDKLPALSPPNPPPLGMTVLRNFNIKAGKAGIYTVLVKIEFDGIARQQELKVRVEE